MGIKSPINCESDVSTDVPFKNMKEIIQKYFKISILLSCAIGIDIQQFPNILPHHIMKENMHECCLAT